MPPKKKSVKKKGPKVPKAPVGRPRKNLGTRISDSPLVSTIRPAPRRANVDAVALQRAKMQYKRDYPGLNVDEYQTRALLDVMQDPSRGAIGSRVLGNAEKTVLAQQITKAITDKTTAKKLKKAKKEGKAVVVVDGNTYVDPDALAAIPAAAAAAVSTALVPVPAKAAKRRRAKPLPLLSEEEDAIRRATDEARVPFRRVETEESDHNPSLHGRAELQQLMERISNTPAGPVQDALIELAEQLSARIDRRAAAFASESRGQSSLAPGQQRTATSIANQFTSNSNSVDSANNKAFDGLTRFKAASSDVQAAVVEQLADAVNAAPDGSDLASQRPASVLSTQLPAMQELFDLAASRSAGPDLSDVAARIAALRDPGGAGLRGGGPKAKYRRMPEVFTGKPEELIQQRIEQAPAPVAPAPRRQLARGATSPVRVTQRQLANKILERRLKQSISDRRTQAQIQRRTDIVAPPLSRSTAALLRAAEDLRSTRLIRDADERYRQMEEDDRILAALRRAETARTRPRRRVLQEVFTGRPGELEHLFPTVQAPSYAEPEPETRVTYTDSRRKRDFGSVVPLDKSDEKRAEKELLSSVLQSIKSNAERQRAKRRQRLPKPGISADEIEASRRSLSSIVPLDAQLRAAKSNLTPSGWRPLGPEPYKGPTIDPAALAVGIQGLKSPADAPLRPLPERPRSLKDQINDQIAVDLKKYLNRTEIQARPVYKKVLREESRPFDADVLAARRESLKPTPVQERKVYARSAQPRPFDEAALSERKLGLRSITPGEREQAVVSLVQSLPNSTLDQIARFVELHGPVVAENEVDEFLDEQIQAVQATVPPPTYASTASGTVGYQNENEGEPYNQRRREGYYTSLNPLSNYPDSRFSLNTILANAGPSLTARPYVPALTDEERAITGPRDTGIQLGERFVDNPVNRIIVPGTDHVREAEDFPASSGQFGEGLTGGSFARAVFNEINRRRGGAMGGTFDGRTDFRVLMDAMKTIRRAPGDPTGSGYFNSLDNFLNPVHGTPMDNKKLLADAKAAYSVKGGAMGGGRVFLSGVSAPTGMTGGYPIGVGADSDEYKLHYVAFADDQWTTSSSLRWLRSNGIVPIKKAIHIPEYYKYQILPPSDNKDYIGHDLVSRGRKIKLGYARP